MKKRQLFTRGKIKNWKRNQILIYMSVNTIMFVNKHNQVNGED